ncbi:MAG: baseplate J/gp47 family protein, partial [Romboutsia sp.]|nr:baseplate J/gp47 family protein [Romboutsia sp.]
MVVPVGSRFSDGTLSYIVTENIAGTNNSRLACETAGSVGHTYYGSLIPISYIDGLTRAELTDIIDSGEDIETDDALRERYLEWVTAPEFGGNISDYQVKVKSLTGVGGCKVIPVWDGGGTVKLIITNSTYGVPDESLVDYVQEQVDPTGDQTGLGIAPIGHVVTVVGAEQASLTVACTLVLETGKTIQDVQTLVDEVVANYFNYLASTWDSNDNLIVRISQIETRILGVSGVLDITALTVNNTTNNIQLDSTEIPVKNGNVVISV